MSVIYSGTSIVDDEGYITITFPHTGQASILSNADHVQIKDSSFSITTNVNKARDTTLEELYQRVAPNAISNEGGRADSTKCHPGTREEVIFLVERWMDTIELNRIFWLSGPAGGGKTAIMKTIADRAVVRGVYTINFFFFRGDPTRNGARPVVPTLLYQLFQIYPHLSDGVAQMILSHPRILDTSIEEQCKLISILSPMIRSLLPAGSQIVLFIDGLDECDVDSERSQGDILHALEKLVLEDESPFRLLVASRPEARIKMAFNQLSSQARTIFLGQRYAPENDIRLFVNAEFDKIKASHPSACLLSQDDWPSLSDVEEIVTKSSGQFIFAATAMRYIARASAVPSLSLERVKGIVPAANNSPFIHLDSIYIFILSRADDPEATRDILSMTFLQPKAAPGSSEHIPLKDLLSHYDTRYTQALVESCVSELSAIVQLVRSNDLHFYHASLPDFLKDQARSGAYWIDEDAFRAKVLAVYWEKPVIQLGLTSLQAGMLGQLKRPTPGITHNLLNRSPPHWARAFLLEFIGPDDTWSTFGGQGFLRDIKRLYYRDDVETYKQILRRWIPLVLSDALRRQVDDIPYAEEYFRLHMNERELGKQWTSKQRRTTENDGSVTACARPTLSPTAPSSNDSALSRRDPSLATPSSTTPHVFPSNEAPHKSQAYTFSESASPLELHGQISGAAHASPSATSDIPLHPSSSFQSGPSMLLSFTDTTNLYDPIAAPGSISSLPRASRSPNFWFDDGSIVLHVETTQFRVHRSVICADSAVFRDIYRGLGETETVDGCHSVVLQGDTTADWDHLLRYMYFPAKGSKPAEHLKFPLVAAMLRLGRKYKFSDIRSLAMSTLDIQVPVDELDVWDLFLNHDDLSGIHTRHVVGPWLAGHEIDLLNLAIDQDIQTILPVAYYFCVHYCALEDILTGIARVDSIVPTLRRPDPLRTVLLGRQRLQSAYFTMTMSWLTQPGIIPCRRCEVELEDIDEFQPNPCEAARTQAFERLTGLDMGSIKPLGLLDDDWYREFCRSCAHEITSENRRQRAKIWRDLPGYFDLPPWSELKDPEC